MKLFVLIVVILSISAAHCARILGIFPFHGKSHYSLGSALMKALAEKGHDVTVISPFGEKKPVKSKGSYRDIVLTTVEGPPQDKSGINMYEMGELSPFLSLPLGVFVMSGFSESCFQEEKLQQLIHSGEKFDAVIVEQFFADSLKALAWHFGGVQILFSSLPANYWTNSLVGNPSPPSYIPDITLGYSSDMTFQQRAMNTLMLLMTQAANHWYLYPKYNQVVQKYIPNAPHINDLLYNASLVLLNSHPSLSQPVPLVPNMVEIGGFHIKPPKKLPEDLQKFIDEAKDGVVYFSMGSNLKSTDLPVEKRNSILKSFSKLKQKVIWKWEEENLPGKPSNVLVQKWCPQHSILAHPNVKLFITHGGALSTTETVYFGVPVLTIPIFADQKHNAKLAVNGGYGDLINFRDLDEETFSAKLDKLLNDPKYTINAKTRARIFHDRLETPLNTALYWIEYVIRHDGAPHLKVAGVDLPWYQYHVLDVILFIFVIVLLGLFVICLVLKKILKRCFCKNQQKIKTN